MTELIQQHKKKGILAAVLLALREGRGVVPLIVTVAVVLSLVAGPRKLIMKIPGVPAIVEKMGMTNFMTGARGAELAALKEAFKLAHRSTPEEVRRRLSTSRGAISNSRVSRVKMVSGAYLKDNANTRINYEGIAKGRAKTIKGVITPEDAKKMDDALPLTEERLIETLRDTRFSDPIRQSSNGGGGGSIRGGGGGAEGKSGLLVGQGPNGGRGAVNSGSDPVGDLLARTRAPSAGRGMQPVGSRGDAKSMRQNPRRKMSAGGSAALGGGTSSPMFELAAARAFSVAAAESGDTAGGGGALMKDAAGLVFDGGREPGEKGSLEGNDGSGIDIPDTSEFEQMKEDAEKREKDAKKCTDSTAFHKTPEVNALEAMERAADKCGSYISACVNAYAQKKKWWKPSNWIGKWKAKYNKKKSQIAQACGNMETQCLIAEDHQRQVSQDCSAIRDGEVFPINLGCAANADSIRSACP